MSPSLFKSRRTLALPLDLLPRERTLVAVQDKAGRWVAATDRAIVTADRRLDWADVGHAQWLDEELVLVVEPVEPADVALRLALPDPGRLPETVHERVMASIVVSRRVPVPGGFVRIVGRDGGDGELRWQVIADGGVDAAAPDVRRTADSAVVALRSELGR